jgi:hypothetical protein
VTGKPVDNPVTSYVVILEDAGDTAGLPPLECRVKALLKLALRKMGMRGRHAPVGAEEALAKVEEDACG